MRGSRLMTRRTGLLVVFGLLTSTSVGLWTLFAADLTQPQSRDFEVTRQVTKKLEREHLLRRAIDNEITSRGLGLFLKGLDPLKVYFTKGDVEQFEKRASAQPRGQSEPTTRATG